MPRRSSTVLTGVVVVFALAVPTALQTMPSPSQMGTRFATNEGDPVFVMWVMQHETETLVHDPTRVFEGNIFWPRQDAIAWSENLLAYVPVFGTVWYVADHNPILAYNVVMFISYLLGALAVFLLARHLLDDAPASLVAAALFSLSTFRSVSVGHVQLAGILFVPFALLFLMRFLERRRRRDAIGLGLAAAGTWFSASYYAVLLLLVLISFVGVWLAQRRLRPGAHFWGGLLLAAVVAGVLVVPALIPYVRLQRAELVGHSAVFEADAMGFVRFPPSLVYRGLPDDWLVAGDMNAFFPGLVLIALVALVVLGREPSRRVRSTYALPLVAGCVVCVLVMIGPGQWGPLDWPYRVMREVVPGVSSLRDLSRFWVFPLLCLALVAGAGAKRVMVATRARRPALARVLMAGAIFVVVCAELVYRPPFISIDLTGERMAVYRALDRLAPGPVTEVPVAFGPLAPYVLAPRQLRSLTDGHPRVEGYSGNFPPEFSVMQDIASAFPAPSAVEQLRRFGVRYVVVHAARAACLGAFGPDEITKMRRRLRSTGGVKHVIEAGSDLVVELEPGRVDRAAVRAVPRVERDVLPCASN